MMKSLREIVNDLDKAGFDCDAMCGFLGLVKDMKRSSYQAGLRGENRVGAVRDRAEVVARNMINAKNAGVDVFQEIREDREWVTEWGVR